MKTEDIVLGAVVTAIFICGFLFGCRDTKADAISHGVGEYYLDENHKRKFRWKK